MENIKRWEKNIYDLELVRNYFKQKVMSDKLSLSQRKYAARECADILNKSKEMSLKFLGMDIDRVLDKGFFYKSNIKTIYLRLSYTLTKNKYWLMVEKDNGLVEKDNGLVEKDNG